MIKRFICVGEPDGEKEGIMGAMERKISVVVACYNAADTLPRCVESLRNQTIGWDAMELIFIDDASTDGTMEYLKKLEKEYPQQIIVIQNEENRKQGICRNIGMQYAGGEYIGFVDADDWVHPEMYQELYRVAKLHQCDMAGCHLCRVEREQMAARGRFATQQEDTVIAIETERQRRELLAQGMGAFGTVHVVTKLYRRKFIEENGIHFGEHYAFEDLYFSDLSAFYVRKFAIIQAEYYHYFIHSNSVMTSMDIRKWLEQRQVMLLWLETCRQRGLEEQYGQEIELMFARDYYISNLHFLLTRDIVGQEEAEAIEKCRAVMCGLFPNAADNIYIQGEGYIHEFQKPLVTHVGTPFRRGELMKIQDVYSQACIEMVRQEKSEMAERTNIQEESEPAILQIMVAADSNYLYPAMVLLVSLFHNHREQQMEISFLHSGLSWQELEQLRYLEGRWAKKKIHLVEIMEEQLQGLHSFDRFSVAAFYRILGLGILPDTVKRVLYLDVDMVVNGELTPLFEMEMDEPLGACYDINNELQGNIDYHKSVVGIPAGQPYFNSGMLLIDMDYVREKHIKDALLADITQNFERYSLIDQDALNKYYCGRTSYLPWQKYNCPCVPFIVQGMTPQGEKEDTQIEFLPYSRIREQTNGDGDCFYDVTNQILGRAVILHFCTSQKPWREREFYLQENMKEAYAVYHRYERMLERILR